MAIFKCKICGGSLSISDNDKIAVCDYCGTKQTLPKLDDEKRVQLYDRANYFRRENEFDKAMGIYEMILSEDKEDYEAYWGIVLCRYGIQYVKDPRTSQRIPTVNRSQFTSIYEDKDYLNAIKYSNEMQREIFTKEANLIDKIQKGILAISSKEEPFDVFICYKETDKNGNRTQDSVYAQDIYNALTKEGYKVFFSRITLEDKLGSAYEPYIFAALNSAKVMLVVGTERDNFNAVWVKNEWSRYISLIKAGKDKTLIPVYKDMSPYDMPEEFTYLQSQDMGKIGYLQDLIHGVKKLVDVKTTTVQETVVVNNVNTNTAPLLKRAFMFLEDGDFARADEFCEQVLNLDPECAEAYLGKLLVNLKVRKIEALGKLRFYFNQNPNCQKAYRFADKKLKDQLDGYVKDVENGIREDGYLNAISKYENSTNIEELLRLANTFKGLSDYKDSQEYVKRCYEKIDVVKRDTILANAKAKMQSNEIEDYEKAIEIFEIIPGWRDSDECISQCEVLINDKILADAKVKMKSNKIEDCEETIKIFKSIPNWKDADECIITCERRVEEIKEEKRKFEEKQAKSSKRALLVLCIAMGIVFLYVFYAMLDIFVIDPTTKYNDAVDLMNDGKYGEAVSIFTELDGFRDSEDKIEECKSEAYNKAVELIDNGEYREAISLLYVSSGYKDSLKLYKEILPKITPREVVSAGFDHTVGLKFDGTVVTAGYNKYGQCDVSEWADIIAISTRRYHTVGLKSDGTVVAVGGNDDGKCDVNNWNSIVAISAGNSHTVGLKSDGTVVAVGYNSDGRCDVSEWPDIVAISAGSRHTVGLKSDGTVVAVGDNDDGQCDVSEWSDIVAISAGSYHTVGLKSDGTVVAVGSNDYDHCDVSEWTDIVAVSAGSSHTVGLKSDGTVVAAGSNTFSQCDVNEWTDIVAISAGNYHTVGLKSDGTVVAVGYNNYGQCYVSNWKNIKVPDND